MTNPLPVPALLVITDPPPSPRTIEYVIQEALGAGCRWVMYREKTASAERFRSRAIYLAECCEANDAVLCINGDIGVAQACGARGVHLQSADNVKMAREALLPHALIGVSCHSIEDALRAESSGADYVTLSPIFETASKPGYGPALGVAGLEEAAKEVSIPLIALAGISTANAVDCIQHGAHGVAVMGGVMRAIDVGAEVKGLTSAINLMP
ncbi:MAG: thiamine phosphate synthase [Alphaproteobacteria bacterium]